LLAAGLKARYRAPRLASPSGEKVTGLRMLSNRPSGLSFEVARSMVPVRKRGSLDARSCGSYHQDAQ